MLMMRDDRYAVAVADAFSRISAGSQGRSKIGVATFQGGVNAAGMQYAYAGMAQAFEDGSPVLCITDGVPAGSLGQQPVRCRLGDEDRVEMVRLSRQARAHARADAPRLHDAAQRPAGPGDPGYSQRHGHIRRDRRPLPSGEGLEIGAGPGGCARCRRPAPRSPQPADLRRRGGHLRGRLGRPESAGGARECAGDHDAQGQRGVPGGPSAVCRRARRSGGALPEQKRPDPRHRHEPVAGPLQPRHSRCGDEDHHPLQRRRIAHQQDVSDGARGDRRCALDLAGAPPGSVRPHGWARAAPDGMRAMWRRK